MCKTETKTKMQIDAKHRSKYAMLTYWKVYYCQDVNSHQIKSIDKNNQS